MWLVTNNFNVVINNRKALSLYNKWQYNDALYYVNKALDEDLNFEYALINKWLILTALCRYDEAIDAYKKVLEISDVIKNNEETDLYFDLWFAYFYKWDYEEAINNFNKDLEFNEDNKETLNYIGLSYYELRDYDKSLDVFGSILKWDTINESNLHIFNNIWTSFLEKWDFAEAIDKFSEVLAVDDTFLLAYYNRALANEQLGNKEAAESDYKKVLEIDADFRDAKDKLNKLKEK